MRMPRLSGATRHRRSVGSGPACSALVAIVAFLAMPVRVDAYLDPGTGSYVFQMVAAVVISVGFVVRGYWQSIREGITRRLRGRSGRDPESR